MGKKLLLCYSILISISLMYNLGFSQWVQITNGIPSTTRVNVIKSSGNNIYVGSQNNGIYISSNNGVSFVQSGLNNKAVLCILVKPPYVFVGTEYPDWKLWRSSNSGINWEQTVLVDTQVNELASNGDTIYAGMQHQFGVRKSTNNGNSFINIGLDNYILSSLEVINNKLFAGAVYDMNASAGIFINPSFGSNWLSTNINKNATCIISKGSLLFTGCDNYPMNNGNGVWVSSNGGNNWSQTFLNNADIYSLATNNYAIYAGTNGNGIYLSTSDGASWVTYNDGFFNNSFIIQSLNISNNVVYAGTRIDGLWKRSVITNMTSENSVTPNDYSLHQNFPNPFNPKTSIKFDIPKPDNVKLIVLDALGREIEVLLNEHFPPGSYEAKFDGSTYSSGIYFYRLQTGDYTETKRMTLIK